jgi:hypothetical protein
MEGTVNEGEMDVSFRFAVIKNRRYCKPDDSKETRPVCIASLIMNSLLQAAIDLS